MVVLVEDHQDTAEVLVRFMARRGIFAFPVSTASEAIELLSVVRPSCLILDYMLPDATGLDVLRRLDESGLTPPPTIMYSAADDDEARHEAWRLGAQAWVIKSAGPEPLLDAVTRVCGSDTLGN